MTSVWSGCTQGSPSSTDGWTTACGPASPIPALARYATWDELAARLVDAQAGSLANRIRRLAGLVGASPDWHGDVLAELGLLHLLSQAARRIGSLPGPLADAVATTVGWQVRQADVLAGVPDTDDWIVAGRSDTREDRIEVRRHWLRGATSGRWALVLSFAAYRQSLDTSLEVGTSVHADLHRYPGPALRALVGVRHARAGRRCPSTRRRMSPEPVTRSARPLVGEPWLDRVPPRSAVPWPVPDRDWVLTDDTGSLPLLVGEHTATLLAVSCAEPVDVTVEWTPHGVVPLTVHLDDRSIDVGPRADDVVRGSRMRAATTPAMSMAEHWRRARHQPRCCVDATGAIRTACPRVRSPIRSTMHCTPDRRSGCSITSPHAPQCGEPGYSRDPRRSASRPAGRRAAGVPAGGRRSLAPHHGVVAGPRGRVDPRTHQQWLAYCPRTGAGGPAATPLRPRTSCPRRAGVGALGRVARRAPALAGGACRTGDRVGPRSSAGCPNSPFPQRSSR